MSLRRYSLFLTAVGLVVVAFLVPGALLLRSAWGWLAPQPVVQRALRQPALAFLGTPSPTPTATATPSPIPSPTPRPTSTPIPTPTATPFVLEIGFWAFPEEIEHGQCSLLVWELENIRAAYLDGQGVVGHDRREVCPRETTSYTLEIEHAGGKLERTVTVFVGEEPPTPTPTPTPTPLPTPDGVEREARVPILMYHHVVDVGPGTNRLDRDLSVAPERFGQHLDYLREHGYQAISLERLLRHIQLGEPLPPRPVVLTFDDGYEDNFLYAYPLLRERAMVGTFFVVSGLVGKPGYLTWEQIRTMAADGMEMGAHSDSHVDLRLWGTDRVVYEVVRPKEAIENATGRPVRFFSYPSGRYQRRTVDILRSAHYWGAVTTVQGARVTGDNLFEMPRLRMRGTTTVAGLAWSLETYVEGAP